MLMVVGTVLAIVLALILSSAVLIALGVAFGGSAFCVCSIALCHKVALIQALLKGTKLKSTKLYYLTSMGNWSGYLPTYIGVSSLDGWALNQSTLQSIF